MVQGKIIKTEPACQIAAQMLGLRYVGAENDAVSPSGCNSFSFPGDEVKLNTNPQDPADFDPNSNPICQKGKNIIYER